MRKACLTLNILGVAAIYLFATGSLGTDPSGSSGPSGRPADLVQLLEAPWKGLNLLGAAVLAAGLVAFAAAAVAVPGSGGSGAGPGLTWTRLFLIGLPASAALAVVAALLIVTGGVAHGDARASGFLFLTGLYHAVLAVVLGALVFRKARPPAVFLPAAACLLVGTAALGVIFWLGRA